MNWKKITKDEKVKQLLINRAYIEQEIKRLDENALIMYELEKINNIKNKIMPRKKSLKKHIKVGSIIRTDMNQFWEVTCLLKDKFQCKLVHYIGQEYEWTQEFNYNIDMIVFNKTGQNVENK